MYYPQFQSPSPPRPSSRSPTLHLHDSPPLHLRLRESQPHSPPHPSSTAEFSRRQAEFPGPQPDFSRRSQAAQTEELANRLLPQVAVQLAKLLLQPSDQSSTPATTLTREVATQTEAQSTPLQSESQAPSRPYRFAYQVKLPTTSCPSLLNPGCLQKCLLKEERACEESRRMTQVFWNPRYADQSDATSPSLSRSNSSLQVPDRSRPPPLWTRGGLSIRFFRIRTTVTSTSSLFPAISSRDSRAKGHVLSFHAPDSNSAHVLVHNSQKSHFRCSIRPTNL